ncbi:hypothetical protein [Bacillus gaemokensis]|uniref:hypothetical protein n=1 Tax=Bacillus gaemokensis TaxID=574375 RepID=UPI000A4F9C69|nr:hypothetical protein [Bacillus gaemokensis]
MLSINLKEQLAKANYLVSLSIRDIEDLMGIRGPRYERRRGDIKIEIRKKAVEGV